MSSAAHSLCTVRAACSPKGPPPRLSPRGGLPWAHATSVPLLADPASRPPPHAPSCVLVAASPCSRCLCCRRSEHLGLGPCTAMSSEMLSFPEPVFTLATVRVTQSDVTVPGDKAHPVRSGLEGLRKLGSGPERGAGRCVAGAEGPASPRLVCTSW